MAFPVINPFFQFFDDAGEPLAGGTVETYESGTSTPKVTYQDAGLTTPNQAAISLDSAGRCSMFVAEGEAFKYILKDAGGVTIDTQDGVKSPVGTLAGIGALLYPRTDAEISAGFEISELSLGYEPGDVRRYGILPNSAAARANNTTLLRQIVSALGTSTFKGKVRFPNTTGSDTYYFNDILPVKDGIRLDLCGSTLDFAKTYASSDNYAGFLYAVRDFTCENGSITVDYDGTSGTNAGSAIRIGNRKDDGDYFQDLYDSELTRPMGNVVLRNLRLTSNNPTCKIIEMTGGLQNVIFENIDIDGQGVSPIGIYYEFGFATENATANLRETSHAHNMHFRNIRIVDLDATDSFSVGIGLTGAYNCTIDGLYVNGARSVFQGTPGESLFYRPWDEVDEAAQFAIVLRNVVGMNITSTAIALTGAVASTGYLSGLSLGDEDETDLADYVIDGFSLSDIDSVGIQSSARTTVIKNGSIKGGTNPIVLTDDCSYFLIDNVTALDSSSVGFRLNFGGGLWATPRRKIGRIVGCKIAGCDGDPAISIDDCESCVIESNRFGYSLTHDGVAETVQLHAVSVGSDGYNVICRNNHVSVASGTAYNLTTSGGSRGCSIEGASGTVTRTGEWLGDGAGVRATDFGDANGTLIVGLTLPTVKWATTLTANRTITLSTDGAYNGAKFRVVRTGLGAFTLNVGGVKTIPSGTAAFVDVEYDGSAWILTGYGGL